MSELLQISEDFRNPYKLPIIGRTKRNKLEDKPKRLCLPSRKTFVGSRRRVTAAWHDTGAIPVCDRLDDICVCNGVLYAVGLTHVSTTYYMRVWSYDPVGNIWTSCGNTDNAGTEVWFDRAGKLVSRNNALNVRNGLSTTGYHVKVFEGGTTWTDRGGCYIGGGKPVNSFAEDGTYLFCGDVGDLNFRVYRWTAPTTWDDSGNPSDSITGDDIYMYRHGSSIIALSRYSSDRTQRRVRKWAGGTTWTDMGKPTHVTAGDECGGASDGSIFYCGSIPGVAAKPEIFSWTSGTTWTARGTLSYNGSVQPRGMWFHNSVLHAGSTSGYVETYAAPSTWTPLGAQPNGANAIISGVSFNSCPYVAVGTKVCYWS